MVYSMVRGIINIFSARESDLQSVAKAEPYDWTVFLSSLLSKLLTLLQTKSPLFPYT